MQTQFDLLVKINKLEAEKKEMLSALQPFTIAILHMETTHQGVFPLAAKAAFVYHKYEIKSEPVES